MSCQSIVTYVCVHKICLRRIARLGSLRPEIQPSAHCMSRRLPFLPSSSTPKFCPKGSFFSNRKIPIFQFDPLANYEYCGPSLMDTVVVGFSSRNMASPTPRLAQCSQMCGRLSQTLVQSLAKFGGCPSDGSPSRSQGEAGTAWCGCCCLQVFQVVARIFHLQIYSNMEMSIESVV